MRRAFSVKLVDELTVLGCWKRATEEHPDDPEARRRRYAELMRDAGFVEDGPSEPLPCGWPRKPPADNHYAR